MEGGGESHVSSNGLLRSDQICLVNTHTSQRKEQGKKVALILCQDNIENVLFHRIISSLHVLCVSMAGEWNQVVKAQ